MKIFAIADLHLSFSTPEKSMEFFGENWKNYHENIKKNWEDKISQDDLVLICGDISWAMHLEKALIDLKWIDSLPGKKIILKGNHDYWWPSISKLQKALPSSIKALQNSSFNFKNVSIAGARLWDTQEFNFNEYIDFKKNPKQKNLLDYEISIKESEKIFERELHRLKISLQQLNKNAFLKIVMAHYPPLSANLKDSLVSKLLEQHNINICVFGHLHNLKKDKKLFGIKNNIKYILTAVDYTNFSPIQIL